MLRLDKLEIRGFKSFFNCTEVVFHEGVTAIVGPNGCGKSNVMDAITWVLGEQSIKNLRGGKMEDVIFNGTRDHKPLGMAEVLLTLTVVTDIAPSQENDEELDFENEEIENEQALGNDGLDPNLQSPEQSQSAALVRERARKQFRSRLPILTAGEKIIVGRRLYRSGDSDYLINSKACRLRDIQEFFSGTGLSRSHYAIIEQGRIGQVLSSKPNDRRSLIEEAAGINKFKAKRHAAELKLVSTKQNLSRLNDLVSEVERQVNNLKRQAAKSRRYRVLREEMRVALHRFFILSREKISDTHNSITKMLEECNTQLTTLGTKLQDCSIEANNARQVARDSEIQLEAAREHSTQVDLEYDRAVNLHKHLNEQISQTTKRQQELKSEIIRLAERYELTQKELERSRKDNESIAQELSIDEKQLAEFESKYRTENLALQECQKNQEQIRSQLLTHITRTERLRHSQHQLTDTETRLVRQANNLENEKTRAAERQTNSERELQEIIQIRQKSELQKNELKQELIEINSNISLATKNFIDAQQKFDSIKREKTRAEDRLNSLRNLDEHHAYYSDAVQTLLKNIQKIPDLQVIGTLADFITVAPQNEFLIENILSDRVQSLLVPTIEDATRATYWLENKKNGRATFLVVGENFQKESNVRDIKNNFFSISDGPETTAAAAKMQAASSFISLLGLSTQLSEIFVFAFPLLAHAQVVTNLDEAIKKSTSDVSRLYITPEGDQVLGGAKLLIARGGEKSSTSVLALKREIKELSSKIKIFEEQVNLAKTELEECDKKLNSYKENHRTVDLKLREVETKTAAVDAEISQHRREVERAIQHCNVITAEQSQLEIEKTELSSKLIKTTDELNQAEEQRIETENFLSGIQENLNLLRPSVEKSAQDLSKIRALVAGRVERRRSAGNELRRLENETKEIEKLTQQLNIELLEINNQISSISEQLSDCEKKVFRYSELKEEAQKKLVESAKVLEELRSKADKIEFHLNELRIEENSHKEVRTKHEIEIARLGSEFEHLARSCHSEMGCELEELKALETEDTSTQLTLESLTSLIDDLRTKIEALGPVNMLALDELQESETRHEFLVKQRADVINAVASTEEGLNEIRKRTKEKFLEAFNQINKNFSEVFTELFGGGRGEMVLIDSDDALESGIDIIAQPPGKRLQSILLLSGGEKAMTALSLVLAIFRFRPSPFCVLDEVDAPLDEANIERFSQKIAEMSLQTQFLVITHNKRTMEIAQSIYGVTMEEPGVSKLLSVRFD